MILKRYLIGILLMTGFLSACTVREFSDDNGLEVAEKDSIRINIQIKSSLVSSRTPVIDPEDDTPDHDGKQHVTYVRLYMFQLTGNNYKLVYDSPVDWTENLPASSVGEDKKTGTHTIAIDSYDADAGYYFVVVGLDAESGYPGYTGQETGGLSGNSADAYWEQIQKFMTEESTFEFNESNKSPSFPEVCGIISVKKGDESINPIPRSEFFAGGIYVDNIKNENITVVANRRVAGIKAYFKGIPEIIDGSEVYYLAFGTGPFGELNSRYNNCLPLLPLYAQGGQEYSDYYSETEHYLPNVYPIIVPVNNSEAGVEKSVGIERSSGTGTLLKLLPDEELIDKNYRDGLAVMGYLPPVVFPAEETGSNSTLMLYLLDEYFQVLSQKKIVQNSEINLPLSREGTGIIPGEGGYDGRYHYPIMANHIYRIGSKGNPVNLDASEAEIVVSIDEFQDEYYGGHLDEDNPDGVNIDTSWGDHDAGNLDNK